MRFGGDLRICDMRSSHVGFVRCMVEGICGDSLFSKCLCGHVV